VERKKAADEFSPPSGSRRASREKIDLREPWRGWITHCDVEGGYRKKWGPARLAAKQKPHRPGIAPALGLRAG
jgi:hypothetical protein